MDWREPWRHSSKDDARLLQNPDCVPHGNLFSPPAEAEADNRPATHSSRKPVSRDHIIASVEKAFGEVVLPELEKFPRIPTAGKSTNASEDDH